ncbi:MAG: hypothetical protein GX496_01005 [Firmicutes bacterium]|nr:hypothetical protein [Bacillota bacterium]
MSWSGRARWRCLLGAAVLATGVVVTAAQTDAAATSVPVRVSIVGIPADAPSGRWDPELGRWIFSPHGGRVLVEWEAWRAEADRLEWDPDEETVQLAGGVRMTGPELRASAGQARIWYAQRRLVLTGAARLEQLPEQAAADAVPLRVVTAPTIQIDDAAGLLTAEAGVELTQSEPSLWAVAETLRYDRQAGRIVMASPESTVQARLDDLRLARASRVEYRLDSDELALYGPAEIVQVQEAAPAPTETGTP